jgi:hypothetical protein
MAQLTRAELRAKLNERNDELIALRHQYEQLLADTKRVVGSTHTMLSARQAKMEAAKRLAIQTGRSVKVDL